MMKTKDQTESLVPGWIGVLGRNCNPKTQDAHLRILFIYVFIVLLSFTNESEMRGKIWYQGKFYSNGMDLKYFKRSS